MYTPWSLRTRKIWLLCKSTMWCVVFYFVLKKVHVLGASVVWYLSLLLMNSFNKTEAATCIFPILALVLFSNGTYVETFKTSLPQQYKIVRLGIKMWNTLLNLGEGSWYYWSRKQYIDSIEFFLYFIQTVLLR